MITDDENVYNLLFNDDLDEDEFEDPDVFSDLDDIEYDGEDD